VNFDTLAREIKRTVKVDALHVDHRKIVTIDGRVATTADEEGTGMAVNVCPADRVQASVEVVWELLMHPAGYGGFWDMTVERVEPEGPAAVGQRFFAWTLCRRLRIDGEILEVDAVRHAIRFHTTLPFGLVGDNRIACSPIDAGSCMLRYG
jgi:hypothetical protein